MTLRPSPVQLDIVKFLKAPHATPEDYARATGKSVETVYVQLRRLRLKDKEARIFHAWFNGTMGSNPNLMAYMKVVEGLSPSEEKEVQRHLQNPEGDGADSWAERRGVKGRRAPSRRKNQGSPRDKEPLPALQVPVRRRDTRKGIFEE